MITKQEIRNSKSSVDILFKAAKTNQLSENCAIFNPIPGVEFNFSIIAKQSIKNNSKLDIIQFVNKHKSKTRLIDRMMEAVFDDKFMGSFLSAESGKHFQRIFTLETIQGENPNIISYIITANYERF